MYKIGIVGYGVVGKGIHRLLKSDVVAVYDPILFSSGTAQTDFGEVDVDKSSFRDLDLAIICVMTKESKDGTCDTSIVEESLRWLIDLNPDIKILIKSTVVPSEIKRFLETYSNHLVFSPEYMGESKYFTPFWKYPDPVNMDSHTFQIFGGATREDTSFCVDIFKRKMNVDTVFIQTDIMTAALTKYMANNFFALKVTFCNEWYDIAKAYGIDYNELRECWLADPRINRNHTLVFPKERGYGGKCFPKDVKALIKDAQKMGVDAELMKAVDKTNTRIRKSASKPSL